MTTLPDVTIYTDGGGASKGGPGGYGVILGCAGKERELSGGFRDTTNGRMELMAAAVGLEALKRPCRVRLVADAQYLTNGINKWVRGWAARKWRNASGQATANRDLWERILAQMDRHEVRAEWVRGHAGHPENERCDRLATLALQQPDLPADVGFERRGLDEKLEWLKRARGEDYFRLLHEILALIGEEIEADAHALIEAGGGRLTVLNVATLAVRHGLNFKATCEWLEECRVLPAGSFLRVQESGYKVSEALDLAASTLRTDAIDIVRSSQLTNPSLMLPGDEVLVP